MGKNNLTPNLDLSRLSNIAKMEISAQPADAQIDTSLIDVEKQVRTEFEIGEEFIASIKEHGILQPLVVHEERGGRYLLIVGERRLRAAKQLGLTEVPVNIKRGLSPLKRRCMQVTENNDRDNLTPFDEAHGVIADAKEYGTKVAMQIWKRSEAWINKRVAVARYASPVKELLQSKACGDFELLHSLNQLHGLNEGKKQFDLFYTKLTSGVPVLREEVRSCVATLKEASNNDRPNKTGSLAETKKASKQPKSIDESESGFVDENVLNHDSHDDLNNIGEGTATDSERLNSHQSDDALWGAFLNSTLPMLINLGNERSARFLAKLNNALKQRSPAELLESFNGNTTSPYNK